MTPTPDPLRAALEQIAGDLDNADYPATKADRMRSIARTALAAQPAPPLDDLGTCWFCKGSFVVDALIAGYDTWEEQRLACLACNERMSGDWHLVACPYCAEGLPLDATGWHIREPGPDDLEGIQRIPCARP